MEIRAELPATLAAMKREPSNASSPSAGGAAPQWQRDLLVLQVLSVPSAVVFIVVWLMNF
jgi:hypothetical protein